MNAIVPPTDEWLDAGSELNVLALNSGSSSLKFGLYRVGPSRVDTLLSGEADAIGEDAADFHVADASGGALVRENLPIPNQGEAIIRIARALAEADRPPPDIIGHRIVHGGAQFRRHCLIDASAIGRLESFVPFAPLHTAAALAGVRFAQARFPGTPQVACFDTAFHADMPDVARILPIPSGLQIEGIQRYGFHGLSCESIVRQVGGDLPGRVIIAHLGAGASVTAVKDGKSIDTSMGLSPTGGVIMATRSGDLDPGVLIYLMRERNFDPAMVEDLVDRQSGLLGISGLSGDMRVLHAASDSNPPARLAVEMFCCSVAKQVAAMIAALDGVDLLVFTGGIGENDGPVRGTICAHLSWIGARLDDARNEAATNPINAADSRCAVLVLPSEEDAQIARHAWALFPWETHRRAIAGQAPDR